MKIQSVIICPHSFPLSYLILSITNNRFRLTAHSGMVCGKSQTQTTSILIHRHILSEQFAEQAYQAAKPFNKLVSINIVCCICSRVPSTWGWGRSFPPNHSGNYTIPQSVYSGLLFQVEKWSTIMHTVTYMYKMFHAEVLSPPNKNL